nr:arginine--tRNA ligase [Spelaeicoccus albus]
MLAAAVQDAYRSALDLDITQDDAQIRVSTRPEADYQCNAAMGIARKVGKPPREVAQAVADTLLQPGDADRLIAAAEVAGPGFINIRIGDDWLGSAVEQVVTDERCGVPAASSPKRFALDYSSPNVAKEMHVGHLRSSIIGDAVARILRFAGHEVLAHNHLGDWGTPFGMLIEHLRDVDFGAADAEDADNPATPTIADLNAFYQQARVKFDSDPEFADRARHRVVLLQSGDEPTLKLWRMLVAESTRHFEQVYSLLGIGLTEDDVYGESFYNPVLADVATELEDKGLTSISDGALCVFPPGFTGREGEPLPLIVRKRDGGYGYAATDLATARYWLLERKCDELLYAVGTPQSLHFRMVFEASRQAGWLGEEQTATHIAFGSMLGADGKMFKTRAGGTIKLIDLLGEAIDRARARLELEDAGSEAEDSDTIARQVGIGAIKYADLSSARENDYVFDWDRMLSMEGNTAAYVQYAIARINSIGRKAAGAAGTGAGAAPETEADAASGAVVLGEEPERALALRILQLPAAIEAAIGTYEPHKICTYLFDTATEFSQFYQKCPILAPTTPPDVRASRLALADATGRVLRLGLGLLGIESPEHL